MFRVVVRTRYVKIHSFSYKHTHTIYHTHTLVMALARAQPLRDFTLMDRAKKKMQSQFFCFLFYRISDIQHITFDMHIQRLSSIQTHWYYIGSVGFCTICQIQIIDGFQ